MKVPGFSSFIVNIFFGSKINFFQLSWSLENFSQWLLVGLAPSFVDSIVADLECLRAHFKLVLLFIEKLKVLLLPLFDKVFFSMTLSRMDPSNGASIIGVLGLSKFTWGVFTWFLCGNCWPEIEKIWRCCYFCWFPNTLFSFTSCPFDPM